MGEALWMECEGQAGLPPAGREPGISRPRVGMVGPETKEEHLHRCSKGLRGSWGPNVRGLMVLQ